MNEKMTHTQDDGTVELGISPMLVEIQQRLTEIHREPAGRNELLCGALLGKAAVRTINSGIIQST